MAPSSAARPAVAASVRGTGRPLEGSTLILLAALWLAAAGNLPFWSATWQATGGLRADNYGFLASLPVVVVGWTYLQLSLLAWGRLTRPVLAVVLLVAAAVGYFASTYGILLDRDMIANVAQTHGSEALELLTARFLAWLLAFGALPALVILRMPVAVRPWRRELGLRLLGMAAGAACLGAVVFANYPHYATLLRTHRELRFMLVPHNFLAAAHGYLRQRPGAPAALQTVGADATRAVAAGGAGKPALTVLVIGETARAANFSLNDYPRETNPELARRAVISFPHVSACGTSTAISVPCMLLDVGQAGFEPGLALRREGLLDVLQRAGIAVSWLDNNSGCKGTCDRVRHRDVRRGRGRCEDGACFDEVLLDELQAELDHAGSDTFIVLHMHGSHGPAYYKRYPAGFEKFTPACRTSELDRCTRESIVNAYDNSLRYTDHVLARVIDLLRRHTDRYDAAMLYVSDHGESLGEKGLYLHGIPYALAPREQTQVPMVLWLSEGLSARRGIDTACLRQHAAGALSHDYVFHSLLGLANVRTSAYRPARDLFRPCRV